MLGCLPSLTIETIDVQMKFEHQIPQRRRFEFAGWVGKIIKFWGAEDGEDVSLARATLL
jgi:hypothetical protein